MTDADITALQLLRTAARVALKEGVIHSAVADRVKAAADQADAIIAAYARGHAAEKERQP